MYPLCAKPEARNSAVGWHWKQTNKYWEADANQLKSPLSLENSNNNFDHVHICVLIANWHTKMEKTV